MPYQSRWQFTPKIASIPDYVFENVETRASNDNDKIFIDARRPDSHFWTMATFRQTSKRFAAGLRRNGFQGGDRLALFAGNSILSPVVVMGTIMAGGIYTSLNPGFTIREVIYQLKDSSPSFVLAAPNCIQMAFEAAGTLGIEKERIFAFEDIDILNLTVPATQSSPENWTKILASDEQGNRFAWESLNTREASNRTAVLAYSSGTTGLPKGVEITHYQIVNNTRQLKQVWCSDANVRERRAICPLPFYHGLGLLYYCIGAPALGLQVYIMERYNVEELMRNIGRYRITELLLVPPMVVAMAKHPAAQKGEFDLNSIAKVVAGAAPLGKEITEQFEQLWNGKVRVQQAWGMSEAPAVCLAFDERERLPFVSTSVGELLPGIEARLVDDDGQDIDKMDLPGELWVRGPNILKGYWRKPDATSETKTSDGWLKTGDVAYVDNDRRWYIVDRKKELIKVRGAQVAPAELEALLLEHPQIVDAGVFGLKTPDGDEAPCAYVVPRHKGMITAEDVASFVRKRAAKQKHLTGGVVFVDSIPRTAAGKILRRALREQAEKENGSQARSHKL